MMVVEMSINARAGAHNQLQMVAAIRHGMDLLGEAFVSVAIHQMSAIKISPTVRISAVTSARRGARLTADFNGKPSTGIDNASCPACSIERSTILISPN